MRVIALPTARPAAHPALSLHRTAHTHRIYAAPSRRAPLSTPARPDARTQAASTASSLLTVSLLFPLRVCVRVTALPTARPAAHLTLSLRRTAHSRRVYAARRAAHPIRTPARPNARTQARSTASLPQKHSVRSGAPSPSSLPSKRSCVPCVCVCVRANRARAIFYTRACMHRRRTSALRSARQVLCVCPLCLLPQSVKSSLSPPHKTARKRYGARRGS